MAVINDVYNLIPCLKCKIANLTDVEVEAITYKLSCITNKCTLAELLDEMETLRILNTLLIDQEIVCASGIDVLLKMRTELINLCNKENAIQCN